MKEILIVVVAGPLVGTLAALMLRPTRNLIMASIAFAAGMMLGISAFLLVPESLKNASPGVVFAGIVAGTVLMFLVEKSIPHFHPSCRHRGWRRSIAYLFLGIFFHNFPEGMAIGSVSSTLTFTVALSIAIHDIPEALCTTIPLLSVIKKRSKVFLISMSTIAPTLLGMVTVSLLKINVPTHAFITSLTAGLMLYLCLDGLIPCTIKEKGSLAWMAIGCAVVLLL